MRDALVADGVASGVVTLAASGEGPRPGWESCRRDRQLRRALALRYPV